MTLLLSILGKSLESEKNWVKLLENALAGIDGIEVAASRSTEILGGIVFIDAMIPDLLKEIEKIDRKRRSVFLLLDEHALPPAVYLEGKVDDVLLYPFRSLEVISKINHYRQLLLWDDVSHANASFQEMLLLLKDDVYLAERLQKAKLPLRFPDVKGFKVTSRYLAGMKSGGDYFDLADAADGSALSVVVSDSSSYGLSSSVLGILMRVAVRLSVGEARSCQETVRRIYSELLATMSERDALCLFYGVISRKTLTMQYLNLGSSCAFHAEKDGKFLQLPSQGKSLSKGSGISATDHVANLKLNPDDRLALISDGFVEAVGGPEKMCELLNRFRKSEAIDFVNELVVDVKSKYKESDDLPPQDCTVMVFDVDARVLRLA